MQDGLRSANMVLMFAQAYVGKPLRWMSVWASETGRPPNDRDGGVGTLTRTRSKTKKPSLYKVILLNDDYTPMEFVVYVLQKFFQKGIEDATRIMLHVHQTGIGICGIYPYEVAETKVTQVMDFARRNEQPLQCTLEKE